MKYKDIMVGEFNLRFYMLEDGKWTCEMPTFLLEAFEIAVERSKLES